MKHNVNCDHLTEYVNINQNDWNRWPHPSGHAGASQPGQGYNSL